MLTRVIMTQISWHCGNCICRFSRIFLMKYSALATLHCSCPVTLNTLSSKPANQKSHNDYRWWSQQWPRQTKHSHGKSHLLFFLSPRTCADTSVQLRHTCFYVTSTLTKHCSRQFKTRDKIFINRLIPSPFASRFVSMPCVNQASI